MYFRNAAKFMHLLICCMLCCNSEHDKVYNDSKCKESAGVVGLVGFPIDFWHILDLVIVIVVINVGLARKIIL